MDDARLSSALERAEKALSRIESALEAGQPDSSRDEALRERVREAVAELDQIIRLADTEA